MDGRDGNTAVIVNGYVDILPARSVFRSVSAIAGHAMAGALEAAELFDIQMQQVTGSGVFITILWLRWIEVSQPVQSGSFEEYGS